MGIEDKVIAYYKQDQIKKTADKLLKPLNEEIKEFMNDGSLTSIKAGDVTATLSVQERATTNNEKLVMRLKDLGLEDAIETVEIPNSEKVEQLVYEGKLIPADIADCIEVKYISVLKVSAKKSKNTAEPTYSPMIGTGIIAEIRKDYE